MKAQKDSGLCPYLCVPCASALKQGYRAQADILGLVVGLVLTSYVYFAVYWWYITVAWNSLRSESYAKYK